MKTRRNEGRRTAIGRGVNRRQRRQKARLALFVAAGLAAASVARVGSADTDTWTGATNGNWDTSAANWLNSTTGVYAEGDTVIFSDSSGANTNITVQAGGVNPTSVTFIDGGAGANAFTFSGGGINGGGTVTLNSGFGGTVTFNASNGYTGATTISGGVLQLGHADALRNTTVTVSAANGLAFSSGVGTFNLGGLAGAQAFALSDVAAGNVNLVVGFNNANTTHSGVISGGGRLVKSGSGQLSLEGQNTYSGGFTLNSGTVILRRDSTGTIGSVTNGPLGTGVVTLNGGAILANNANNVGNQKVILNAVNVNAGVTVLGASSNNANLKLVGPITGTGTLSNSTAGTTATSAIFANDLSGFTGTFAYDNTSSLTNFRFGNNTGTQAAPLTGQIVDASQARFIIIASNPATITRNVALTDFLSASTLKIGELSGNGVLQGAFSNGALTTNTYEVGYLNTSTTFSGRLSNATGGNQANFAVTKVGTGTLTLTAANGDNLYTGGTNINAGAIQVGIGGTTGNLGPGAIVNNSTLAFNRSNTLTQNNAISGSGALYQDGSGTLILGGAHTGTGSVNVNAGTLQLNGNVTSATINVAGGGALLRGGGTLGGRVNLNGAVLSQLSNSIQTFTLNGGLSVGASSTLGFDLGATPDLIAVGPGATVSVTGAATINLSDLGGVTPGTYNLMTFDSGAASGLGNFTLGTQPLGFNFSLNPTATALQLVVVGIPSPANAFWSGDQSTTWATVNAGNNTNWATTSALTTDTNQVPGSSTTVHFDNITSNLATTLGGNFAIKNLTFGDQTINTGNVTIGGASNTLSIFDATGISVAGGSATNTISVGTLNLNASQSWTNNSSGVLTVSSTVTGVSSGLTINGSGPVLLSGSNTYGGGTTLSSGTLLLGHANALGSGAVALNGGTLDLNGTNPSIGGAVTSTAATTITNNGAQSATFTFAGGTFAGKIQDGGQPVAIANASGTTAITNNNTYTGGTTINGGTVQTAADANLGTGALLINAGALQVTGSFATSRSITVGAASSTVSVDAARTLTLNSGIHGGAGTGFTKAGAGTLILNAGDSLFDGGITLNGGYTQINNPDALGSLLANTTVGNGATLDLNGQSFATAFFESFDNITGAGVGGIGALYNSSATAAEVLNIGGPATGNFTVGGVGDIVLDRVFRTGGTAFTMTKIGNNTVTLANAADNTNLVPDVQAGTLILAATGTGVKAVRDLNVNGGYVKLGSSGGTEENIAVNGTVNVNSGTFDMNGFSESFGPLGTPGNMASAGVITNNAGGISNLTVGAGNTNGNYAGRIIDGAGAVALAKIGTGSLSLWGNNTYSGATRVDAGTLVIRGSHTGTGATDVNGGALVVNGSLASTGAVNVNATATSAGELRGTGSVGNVTLAANNGANVARISPGASIGTLTASSLAVNGGDLNFEVVSPANSDRLNVNGAVSFNAASTLTLVGAPASGTYVLIDSTNPISYTVQPTLVTPSDPNARPSSFTPDTTTDNTQYRVVVNSGALSLTWTGTDGTNPTNWDVKTSVNWVATNPEQFWTFDSVTFADGPTNRNINIVGNVQPTTTTVSSSAGNDYAFGGTGAITGVAALVKTGTGALTITNSNSYTGGTTLNSGVLNVAAANSVGSGVVTVNGGALNVASAGGLGAAPITFNGGTIDNTTGAAATLSGNNGQTWGAGFTFAGTSDLNMGTGSVALAANSVVTVSANTLTVGGAINNGTGGTGFTKAGSGTLNLTSNASTFNGNLVVNAGTLVAGSTAAANDGSAGPFGNVATPGKTITVNAGAGMLFTTNNVFGNQTNLVPNLPTLMINGGVVNSTRYNHLGNVVLNGGTLTQSATDSGNYQGYEFTGTITVGGSAPSVISTGNGKANHLVGSTVFNVGDATGDAQVDLTVSSPLTNSSGDFNLALAGLTKTGPGTMALTSANSFSAGATVNAGTLIASNVNAFGPGTLTANTGGTASLAAGLPTAVKLPAVTIAGGATPTGTVDLNDNDMVVGSATAKSIIEAQVRNARNAGAWNQPGFTSSSARNNANHTTGLGVLSGAEYSSVGGTGTFAGQTYSATDTLIKYTWNGDANFDGRITFDDYVKIDTGFNTGLTGWLNGDFNYSGSVNFDDYVLIDIAFNQQSGTLGRAIGWITGDDRSTAGTDGEAVQTMLGHLDQFGSAYGAAFLAAVPEPSALMLGVPALAALGSRRRRRRASGCRLAR